MKLDTLVLENFGPFRNYEISFTQEDNTCLLLTGKNNEGKSNIIFALKLISAATRSVGRRKFRVIVNNEEFYRLPQPEVEGISIGRLLHNYEGSHATIRAIFENRFVINVFLDQQNDIIYAEYLGNVPNGIEKAIGIIPPLGMLAEKEEYLTLNHVRSSINTSLAPRHLRNHFVQILTPEEYTMVRDITGTSWPSIELLMWERNIEDNTLSCFFKEGRIDREICWVGQGLQVWFQIITHLVRLRDTSIIVLDEPEINLHPEKQNDLIRLLREYHSGSSLIATHSVELMNNVNVSHILHINKAKRRPLIKSTKDKVALDIVRSQIGSTFNLIASQFDAVDKIIFTEGASDYGILTNLAAEYGLSISAFNVPLHGFSEYKKAVPFKEAYKLLIGRKVSYSIVLDKDHYPNKYLENIREELISEGIKLVLTPGKEIENLFLSPNVLREIIPAELWDGWIGYWEDFIEKNRLDSFGSFITLHEKYILPHIDKKTIILRYTPCFEAKWENKVIRHLLVNGKEALKSLRAFYRNHLGINLTQQMLIAATVKAAEIETKAFIEDLFRG